MAMAADVPAGVQLAEKQTLVRNSGAEPQSLDPNKIEGVPEANISRDLFEGLLNTSPKDGHPILAWRRAGIIKILKSGPSICVKMQNGLTASRLPPRTSYTAGGVWWIRKQLLLMPAIRNMVISLTSTKSLTAKKAPSELGVKAIDDHTLEVTLSEPVPYFYKLLVNPAMSPVYKPAIENLAKSGRSLAISLPTARIL